MTRFVPLSSEVMNMFVEDMWENYQRQRTILDRLDACKTPSKKPMKPPRPARRGR